LSHIALFLRQLFILFLRSARTRARAQVCKSQRQKKNVLMQKKKFKSEKGNIRICGNRSSGGGDEYTR
jgi:hypothetical protein